MARIVGFGFSRLIWLHWAEMIFLSLGKQYQRRMLEFILKPWHLLVLFLASHLNQEQQRVIEYLQVENQVLREKLGKKRILLNDDQRQRGCNGRPNSGGTTQGRKEPHNESREAAPFSSFHLRKATQRGYICLHGKRRYFGRFTGRHSEMNS